MGALGQRYRAVVIGTSAGGTAALAQLLPMLPATFSLPVVIVQHIHPLQASPAIVYYHRQCHLVIEEAALGGVVEPGRVYFAPPNYHLLIEDDRTFSLSVDVKVNYARPSIDVLFESAADAYGRHLIGVILTGANNDGARGLRRIKEHGGLAVVQEPDTAEVSYMPRAAIDAVSVDYVLPPPEIGALLAAQSVLEDVV
ncbi:MAG: chemotaxis protein CheB [Anaerolineae bacterium]|nr:chemotaxis protein CheB [Anaerolineae bacterium]